MNNCQISIYLINLKWYKALIRLRNSTYTHLNIKGKALITILYIKVLVLASFWKMQK